MTILYLEGAFSTLNISSNKTFLFSVQNVNNLSRFFGIFIGIFNIICILIKYIFVNIEIF